MDSIARFIVAVGTLAVVLLLASVAYFIKWQGESYAAGILSGIAIFSGWYKLKYGRWP